MKVPLECEEECPCQNRCICTEEFNPICGVDGRNYDNPCKAKCHNIEEACKGECPCKKDCSCPDIYLPCCGLDGVTYKNLCEIECAQVS